MPPRAVLDTNVIISGLLYGGPPGVILELVLDGTIERLVSLALAEELAHVLERKFPDVQQTVLETLAVLREVAIAVIPDDSVTDIPRDPTDKHVLICAASGRADAIVSGDKDLLTLQTFRDIPILTPQAFLDSLHPKPR